MATSPRVSVIMNCLDGEEHLAQALESVFAQTFPDYEIVFWDNCSTDRGPGIVQRLSDRHPGRVRYFRGKTIVPLGAGRNLAIAKARGEFIAFLDCDDLWEPTKLEKQVALFDANPRVGLVTCDTVIFDGSRELRRFFAGARPGRGMVFEDLVGRQWISMSSAVIRREALAGLTGATLPAPCGSAGWSGGWFDETLSVCEEADVFYRVAHDWELDYVDEPLARWRVHGSNTTFRKFALFAEETRRILAKHRALYPDYDRRHPALVALLNRRSAFEEAVALWQAGQGAEARRVIAPYRTASRKNMLFWLLSFLPGCVFDTAARIYFALPKLAR